MVKLPDKEFINTHDYFFIKGSPEERLLHKYFYMLDLHRFNFYLTEPLDIRNFVVEHTTYTSDEEVYKQGEYWPQNIEDVNNILRNKKEDCDGLAILTASLLYSIGNPYIQIAIGYYGNPDKAFYSNHAYCLLFDPIVPDDPFLLETTGIYSKDRLERASEFPKHNTLVSCNAKGEYWVHNFVERKYRETLA